MKIISIKISMFVLFLCLFACEEKTEWSLQKTEYMAVVDALFTDEYKNHRIKYYSTTNELNLLPAPISNAEFKLFGNNTEYTFSEDSSQFGTYVSNQKFSVAAGVTYMLTLEHLKTFDTAFAELVAITPMEPISIVPNDNYYRLEYKGSSKPSMLEVYYDWSNSTEYCTEYGACHALETFYTLESLDISKTFAAEKQIILFPLGTTIIRRKYSLSTNHQKFIRSLLLETEWRGGIFDVEHGNVRTNFRHGTLGWFGVSMVLSDTSNIAF